MLDYFKLFLTAVFRYLPFPHKTGLIKLGNPDENSPVFVSGNFFYTVFKLKKYLSKKNCYLLVCDSAGINVWCASGAGDFNEHKIADEVNASSLKNLVRHRTLIVPQLAAVGINPRKLKAESSFTLKWGPVDYRDIDEFLASGLKAKAEMRKAKYSFCDNLHQALGLLFVYLTPFYCYLVFMLIFGTKYNFFAIPAFFITLLLVLSTVFTSYLPFKWPPYNLIFLNVFTYIFTFATFYYLSYTLLSLAFLSLVFLLVLIFVCYDSLGSTVFYKTTMKHFTKNLNCKSLFQPKLSEACTACQLCIKVCPKGIFELSPQKKLLVNLENECCECLACIKQCPVNAIRNLNAKTYKKDIKSIDQDVLDIVMS